MNAVDKASTPLRKFSGLYSSLCIIFIWYLLHYFVNDRIIPTPHSTFIVFIQQFPAILGHIIASLYRIIVAIFFTLIIGVPLGLLIATHQKLDDFISPLIYALYPIPKIAFLPLLMLFFGLGNASKIILVSLIIIFQVIVSTRDSVKGINSAYYLSIRSLGATKKQVYQHMILPAVLPNLLTALRLSLGTSISVLFFAENFATQYGIGYFIMDSWLRLAYTEMFAGIVAISLMGSLLFKGIDWIEYYACPWQRANTSSKFKSI